MWVLIDNYDSFTYILLHYLLQTGNECKVYRNDEITIEELRLLNPDRIVISPGPETPVEAGITMQVIDCFHASIPILGVCLGHQAIGMYFGAKLVKTEYPMHGKASNVFHVKHQIFKNIPSPFKAMRYHSLVIEQIDNTHLIKIAETKSGKIMAVAHKEFPCIGVQFHPESVGTEYGMQILKNWAEQVF